MKSHNNVLGRSGSWEWALLGIIVAAGGLLTITWQALAQSSGLAASQSGGLVRQIPLRDGWAVQSSAHEPAPGEKISSAAFRPTGWYHTTVPKTVLSVLVDNK